MSNPETQASQGTLRKELGLIVLIFLMIGLNVGGSPFVLTSKAAGITGPFPGKRWALLENRKF